LVDSLEQLHALEQFTAQSPHPTHSFDVLLELGLDGGRTGCRSAADALTLARAVRASAAARLVGLECYEGLWAKGDTLNDTTLVAQLMQRVHDLARQCDAEDLFQGPEVLLTAGGSAVFDLVAPALRATSGQPLALSRPVRGLLRSGCYLTHDHGFYKRLGALADQRLAQHGLNGQPWDCGNGLQAALEVWAVVQSCPEPGLAILNAGKRDLSFDMGLPTPVAWCPAGTTTASAVQQAPNHWAVTALNDQHAYLALGSSDTGCEAPALHVGDRVALGISHPCTTFDKWRWMPLVNDELRVVGAITTRF
jgi:D-serine dehydratase